MTWVAGQSGTGQPAQLLTRRIRRRKAKILVCVMGGATSIVFNSKLDPLTNPLPQGFTVTTPTSLPFLLPEWENQQPLYAIGVGGTPTISVIDEAYED